LQTEKEKKEKERTPPRSLHSSGRETGVEADSLIFVGKVIKVVKSGKSGKVVKW
jgi:hypothetical protein